MATPTSNSKVSSAQQHSQHVAMTPGTFANHLAAFSPARSVPSPATAAQQKSQRSPFVGNSHAPNALSSTPNTNAALNFDSPSAAATLGLNLGNIGTLTGVDNVGGSVNVRGDEEERKRRIEAILDILRTRPGKVSPEGVERLARRTGLDCLWEGTTLSIAGSSMMVDVEFKGDAIENVSLTFPTSSDAIMAHSARGAAILRKDLVPRPGESRLNKTLDKFADNLERLASLDKLSTQEMNCYEAVSGVYASLRRIFEHEKKKLLEKGEDVAEREVMCKESGRPRMHAGKRVGLSLEYWMERREIPYRKRKADAMDTDTDEPAEGDLDECDDGPKIWSAVVECESSPAELYPSIRISNDWVSQEVEKQPLEQSDLFNTDAPTIDWLEPEQTYLPASSASQDNSSAMAVDGGADANALQQPKLPDVRFVARLEPPVIVPLQTAVEIYSMLGSAIPQESIRPTTFDGLILPLSESENAAATAPQGEESREVVCERTVLALDAERTESQRRHRYTVFAQKQDFGRAVEEIPFSHPRQLLAVLPILRQYARTASILHTTLEYSKKHNADSEGAPQATTATAPPVSEPAAHPTATTAVTTSITDELDALLSTPASTFHSNNNKASTTTTTTTIAALDPNGTLPVSLTLSTHPQPRISLIFPLTLPSAPHSAAAPPAKEIEKTEKESAQPTTTTTSTTASTTTTPAHASAMATATATATVTATLTFDILLNGEVAVREWILSPAPAPAPALALPSSSPSSPSSSPSVPTRERVERALDVAEDVAVVVEFLRTRMKMRMSGGGGA
ncbi:MAG: hypothetical protein M1819_007305 [Sarea resinae]|nr:MAG: hypothetical protein M1819_007305 [Sarea resinae]